MSTTLEAQLAWQQNSVFVAEWIQRALLGLPVELDERQRQFMALYRKTEHAKELKRSLASKWAKTALGRSEPRTLADLRREDVGTPATRPLAPVDDDADAFNLATSELFEDGW